MDSLQLFSDIASQPKNKTNTLVHPSIILYAISLLFIVHN